MTTKGKDWQEAHKEHREAALKGKKGRPKAAPPGEGKTSEDTTTKEIRTNDRSTTLKVEKDGRAYDVKIKEGSPEKGHRLTKKQRDSIPAKYFAGPNRSFPVEDKGHVQSALGHLKTSHYSPAEKKEIEKKIESREKELGME